MSSAVLSIRVIQPRMMTKKQAADYVGLTVRKFEAVCPVSPIAMDGDLMMYDVRDLDAWLDQIKQGSMDGDDDILRKLL